MKKQIALLLSLLLAFTLAHAQQSLTTQSPAQETTTQFPQASAYANTELTYKIIDAPNQTFGYDVLADGRLMIHQISIPAMPGNEGFKPKEDAEKVALLIIEKMKKGEMPPTVSIEEMKELNAIK